jgi:prepilin-type N-terminal cleavage/methylation domain-containing protein
MTRAVRHPGAATRRGFSFLELVVVLAILAVVAGMAVASYGPALHRYRADAAARHIVADLGLARAKARQASQGQTVVFSLTNQTVRLNGVADLDRPTATYEVRLAEAPYYARIVSANFGGATQVTFDGYGTPSSTGTVVIEVGGFLKTVALSGVTGRAAVQKGVGVDATH